MKYTKINNIHIVEIPVQDFKIVMNDSAKKTAEKDNYCNAGFFATYHENKQPFTLPVAHLLCDHKATNQYNKKYCQERGKFNGNKFTFDSSTWSYQNPCHEKAISTLLVSDTEAKIDDIVSLPQSYNYALGGIPIMRDGEDVTFNTYVKGQGWDASSLYATWHIFAGLKQKTSNVIYIMSMKTTTSNMIKSAEAFNKFKQLGFYDVIKLDGGGSTYLKVNGKAVVSTLENRRINNIILFSETKKTTDTTNNTIVSTNPYKEPTVVVKSSKKYNENALWVQWQLNSLGFDCGKVDGFFGTDTLTAVLTFQEKTGLRQDGKVGPATRAVLKNYIKRD